jgi:hypothetical protein
VTAKLVVVGTVVGEHARERRSQIRPVNFAPANVRQQNGTRQDVIEPLGQARSDRDCPVGAGQRIGWVCQRQAGAAGDPLDGLEAAGRWTEDVLVQIAGKHILAVAAGREEDVNEEVRDRAGLRRPPPPTVGVLAAFQVRCENVQRFRRSRQLDFGLEQVAGKHAVVAKLSKTRPGKPRLRARDRKAAGDDAANEIVRARVGSEVIAGQPDVHEIRHFVGLGPGDFVERDDVGVQGRHLPADGLNLRGIRAPVRRSVAGNIPRHQGKAARGRHEAKSREHYQDALPVKRNAFRVFKDASGG